jgi:hypothetical protein
MANPLWTLFLGIGLIFGSLAGLMAYLITYNEYTRHYQTKKEPRKMALEAAVFTFFFFFILALLIGYFLLKT